MCVPCILNIFKGKRVVRFFVNFNLSKDLIGILISIYTDYPNFTIFINKPKYKLTRETKNTITKIHKNIATVSLT